MPLVTRSRNDIFLNEALFRRIEALQGRAGTLGLTPEQRRVLDRYHALFVRAGARLDPEAKARLARIAERISALETRFNQNVLADETNHVLVLGEGDLAGLPDSVRQETAEAARARGLEGHVVTLARSGVEPFLQFSARRDLREKAYRMFAARGDNGGDTDNKRIVAEILALRAEEARLLGYPSYAHYQLADQMAGTPDRALGLMRRVWGAALCRASEERGALQALVRAEGGGFALAPWDWRYYAERHRAATRGFDESDVKPYLPLERMIEAAFYTAERLFGLRFEERPDVPVYHPDVRVWEVRDAEGRLRGLFYGDYLARPGKRGGSWMSTLRDPQRLSGEVPVVLNVTNFAAAAPGAPVLLTFEDAGSVFHEFGHALHALLSDVTYPLIAGTNVAGDFAEFPAQLYEHWLEEPEVLGRFARHYRTGEPMPKPLLDQVLAARKEGQGSATVEYLASAFADLDAHLLTSTAGLDVAGFERTELPRIGMPPEIGMLHRLPNFGHAFGGDGYAAGYYGYLWSEVLDTDGFRAFEEARDPFDPALAARLRRFVYAAGALRDPAEAYEKFRGRPPTADALLEKRGFAEGCGAKSAGGPS